MAILDAAETLADLMVPPGNRFEKFLKPLAVSQYKLAKEIAVPARRINEIVHGQRRISADTALRLARSSAPPSGSGSTCRPGMTRRPRRTASATRSTRSGR